MSMSTTCAAARWACLAVLVGCSVRLCAPAKQTQAQAPSQAFPFPEELTYRIEWRLVNAGIANLQFKHAGTNDWQIELDVESAGVVNRLYRVLDKYTVNGNDHFCPSSVALDAQEGKKHTVTSLSFDAANHSVSYHERDTVKNTDKRNTLTIGACTHDVAGALAALGESDLQPGRSTFLSVTDGKKVVSARIEAQAKEQVTIDTKTYNTIRYEAFLFDNVLYKRRGRLFLWLTNDAERTPVQFKLELGFPVGNIFLELEKQQRL